MEIWPRFNTEPTPTKCDTGISRTMPKKSEKWTLTYHSILNSPKKLNQIPDRKWKSKHWKIKIQSKNRQNGNTKSTQAKKQKSNNWKSQKTKTAKTGKMKNQKPK